MWYDVTPGVVLKPGDEVRAIPYFNRTVVECQLIERQANIWIAKDLEVSQEDLQKHYGDMSKIKLTDDMILRVWRD